MNRNLIANYALWSKKPLKLTGSEGELQNGDVVKGDRDEFGSDPLFKKDNENHAYVQGTLA